MNHLEIYAPEASFIDTHAHYNIPAFAEDLGDVIKSVRRAGVGKIICPAISYSSNAQMLSSLDGIPDMFFALGIHPKRACPRKAAADTPPENVTLHRLRTWHASRVALMDELEKEVESLRPIAESVGRVVAIGEAGLDWSLNPGEFERTVQVALFRAQIELALQLHLPLVLHIRDAYDDAIEVLRYYRGAARGVVHCFAAGPREADECLDLGLHLGIGGYVTHRNRVGLRNAVAMAPTERLLLETDAPYVLPKGFGSKRNDSTAIPLIAQEVADLRGIGVEDIAHTTTSNAEALFFQRARPVG